MKFLIFVICLLPASAETLRYSINWQSGLSLGEATLDTGAVASGGFDSVFDVDASVPAFPVKDHYHSTSSPEMCSAVFEKTFLHGTRKTDERLTFDQKRNVVMRETLHGGGKAEISVSSCARDPLAFLQFVRKELAQGRLAPQQAVVYGAVYQLRLEYTGVEALQVANQRTEVDHITVNLKGPASDVRIEFFFARDAVRTPVVVRVPSSLGTFSLELVR